MKKFRTSIPVFMGALTVFCLNSISPAFADSISGGTLSTGTGLDGIMDFFLRVIGLLIFAVAAWRVLQAFLQHQFAKMVGILIFVVIGFWITLSPSSFITTMQGISTKLSGH